MNKKLTFYRAALLFMAFVFCVSGSVIAQGQWRSAGQNINNTRNAATETTISEANANQLAVKWAFTTGGDVSATPAVDGDYVYFPDWAGFIYKVDNETGEQIWKKAISEFTGQTTSICRSTPLITGNEIIFGTQLGDPVGLGATVIALDKDSGKLLWQTKIDDHFASVVTQSAVALGNMVYVGVASQEEVFAAFDPTYQLSFRGSLVALDKNTGAIKWKTYMTPGSGFTGCAVWGSTPVIDPKRGSVYVTTGNNYSVPQEVLDQVAEGQVKGESAEQIRARVMTVPGSSDNHFDAVVSLDLTTGAIKWATSVIPYDAWTGACFFIPENCPDPEGPDYDFGQGAALFTAMVNGKKRELLGAGQKSGTYWTLNPDNGQIIWSTNVGPGGTLGGLQWGSATDGNRIYTAVSNNFLRPHVMGPGPKAGETVFGGFWSALDAGTGQVLWENAGSNGPVDNPYFPPYPSGTIATNQGPVTVANGVVYAGAMDTAGTMYAFNATTGNILWSFESGGSVLSGAAVVDGVVYWGSGYSNNFFGTPNNKLFAFSLSSLNKAGVQETNNTAATPTQFSLEQNYPNPFNPATQIRFSIPETASVTLKIYDTMGQLVKTLVDGSMSAGVHQVTWDATDNNGNNLAGGVYFYRLNAGTFTQTHKMLLLK